MPRIVFARRRRIGAEMHAVPFDALEQMHVLERLGAARQRIQGRGQHRDIALDVLDAAFPERRARGKEGMRHRLDGFERAPARGRIGQVGGEMRERRVRRRRGARQAIDVPAGPARQRSGDRRAGRTGRSDDEGDPVSHGGPAPLAAGAGSYRRCRHRGDAK